MSFVFVRTATFLAQNIRSNSVHLSVISKRQKFSFRQWIPSLFRNKSPEQTTMSTVAELEQERKELEAKVHDLVDKLEAKKGAGEIRLTKDQVIKSKEERDATAAMEKLDLKQAEEQKKNTEPSGEAQTDKPAKKSEPKGGKQKGGAKEPPAPERPVDVSRLDLRIGKIIEVDRHPDADSLYVEKIDCGDETGPRTVISGLVKHVPIDEMRGRNVVVLCNLKPAKMRGILSEAMVMCASTPDKVELLGTPDNVKPGDRVVFEKYPGEPDAQLNPKKKIWETVAPDIKTNADGVPMYKDCQFKLAGNEGLFKSNLKNVQIR